MSTTPHPDDRPPLARGALIALLLVVTALHLAAIANYGWFRDEFYYLSCAKRLAWGYVDQPPFSIAVLAAWLRVFGDSLLAVRAAALLVGLATIAATVVLTRAFGGGRWAQMLAGLATAMSPIHRAITHYYSMNVFDQLAWPLVTLATLAALRRDRARDWLWLGLVIGLGALNKVSMLWCAGGLVAGVLVTTRRDRLATRGPWLAALIAAALFAPHVAWQVARGWPTLEWMHNAAAHKMLGMPAVAFIASQLMVANPLAAPIWLTGLVAALRGRHGADGRIFGVQYVAVALLLIVMRAVRAEYLGPAYTTLFALGAVSLERTTVTPARRGWRIVLAVAPVVGMALLLPLVIPVLPVGRFVEYQRALHLRPATEEHHTMGSLPQHYADMFGWPGMEAGVARACATLTPAERTHAVILAQNYGEAGAIEYFGARDHLPPVICGHNNWWLWGTHGADGSVIVVLGAPRADEIRDFASYTVIDTVDDPRAMPYERGLDVGVGRGLRFPLAGAWARIKDYN